MLNPQSDQISLAYLSIWKKYPYALRNVLINRFSIDICDRADQNEADVAQPIIELRPK